MPSSPVDLTMPCIHAAPGHPGQPAAPLPQGRLLFQPCHCEHHWVLLRGSPACLLPAAHAAFAQTASARLTYPSTGLPAWALGARSMPSKQGCQERARSVPGACFPGSTSSWAPGERAAAPCTARRTARPAPSSGPTRTASWGSCKSCRQAGWGCGGGGGVFWGPTSSGVWVGRGMMAMVH